MDGNGMLIGYGPWRPISKVDGFPGTRLIRPLFTSKLRAWHVGTQGTRVTLSLLSGTLPRHWTPLEIGGTSLDVTKTLVNIAGHCYCNSRVRTVRTGTCYGLD